MKPLYAVGLALILVLIAGVFIAARSGDAAASGSSDLGCIQTNGNGVVDRAEVFAVIAAFYSQNPCPASGTPDATPTPEPTPAPTATPTPTPAPSTTKGPGTYEVGVDLDPGIYAGRVGTDILDSCYWASRPLLMK